MSISGVVDVEVKELFVRSKTGAAFAVGETITGTAGWNTLTSPERTSAPTAIIVAGNPNLTSPTSLIISNITRFFVDGETITAPSTGQAVVDEPFPNKRRLEQISLFWYSNGMMTLTTRSGDYKVFISGMDFNMEAGLEDRYRFKIDFVEVSQSLASPV